MKKDSENNVNLSYTEKLETNNNEGVLFFNSGAGCLLRLFVSMFTLRRYYNGNVAVLLNKEDERNEETEKHLKLFDAKCYYYDKPDLGCKRNSNYTVKPFVLNLSPFKYTMFVDSDTLFCADVKEFLELVKKHDLVVTPYKDWITTGKRINKRIIKFSDLFTKEEFKKAIEYGTAINTGVLGYSKNTKKFFKEWIEKTFQGKGRFIVDELTAQYICCKYKHYLTGQVWNYSCKNIKFDTAKIIHFHGRKHARLHRCQAASVWINAFIDFMRSNIIDEDFAKDIINKDSQVRKCKIYEDYIEVKK